jgi:hypothetical protein
LRKKRRLNSQYVMVNIWRLNIAKCIIYYFMIFILQSIYISRKIYRSKYRKIFFLPQQLYTHPYILNVLTILPLYINKNSTFFLLFFSHKFPKFSSRLSFQITNRKTFLKFSGMQIFSITLLYKNTWQKMFGMRFCHVIQYVI